MSWVTGQPLPLGQHAGLPADGGERVSGAVELGDGTSRRGRQRDRGHQNRKTYLAVMVGVTMVYGAVIAIIAMLGLTTSLSSPRSAPSSWAWAGHSSAS
ncbi:hypothetical protein ACTMTF_09800 [Nonomuraea sp. ZG12]|uniref:hypothetical protein n=1 Tax=Nonomuraea sp. ZG12 TaxID=3452207 RepID=UPI003F8A96F4